MKMSFWNKTILISLYLIFHFFVISDVRTHVFEFQIIEVQTYYNSPNSEINIDRIHTRIIDFDYPDKEKGTEKVWTYKIPFGFFFLLGILGLLTVGSNRKYYIVLLVTHLVVLLAGSLVFYLSINVNTWLLAINDLLTRYINPMISIGVVAFALLEKRK